MKRGGFSVMTRLLGLVRPLIGVMTLAVAMGIAGHLCATFLTVLAGIGLVEAVKGGSLWWLIVLPILALLRAVLRYGEQACNHYLAFKLLARLRDQVFGALRRLAPAKLEGRDRGDLISLITSDIELLEVFYAHTISPICIAVVFCALLTGFIGRYHWALGLLALTAYGVVGLVIPLVTSRLSGEDGLKFRRESGGLSAFVLDSLRGLPEILQYGQGPARLNRMEDLTDGLAQKERRMKNRAGWNSAVTNGAILLFDLAMLVLASGLCDFSGTVIVTLALMSSFGPVVALAALGSTLQNTFAAGNRVLDLLDEEPITRDVSGKAAVEFAGAAAKNVTFGYGAERVLEDVSLEIPKQGIVGIVGPSGCGKSTLLKLMMRFWQVDEGEISVSDRNVNAVNTVNLRAMEGFVTQDTHLFHDSIRNNLRLARLDATDEQIEAACKKASVHDFIMTLPKGYDTQVGELGDTLSGGERQRLGLARALLHDAPFLLLDEPTSNLDSLNEGAILRALHGQCGDKAILLVSHRPSTMGIARKVYRFEKGRVTG